MPPRDGRHLHPGLDGLDGQSPVDEEARQLPGAGPDLEHRRPRPEAGELQRRVEELVRVAGAHAVVLLRDLLEAETELVRHRGNPTFGERPRRARRPRHPSKGEPVSPLLLILLLVILLIAIGGGIIVSKLLYLLLIVALIVLLFSFLSGRRV